MKSTTISSKGQVAIPKEIRESLHIEAGDRFIVEVEGNTILLRPAVTVTVPKEQAYFWTPEVQGALQNADNSFRSGAGKSYSVDEFVEELEKR
jgi:AbrB family looped-hinge helix DNA binding protein